MWHNHAFSQGNKATKIARDGGREGEGWKSLKKGISSNVGDLHKTGGL